MKSWRAFDLPIEQHVRVRGEGGYSGRREGDHRSRIVAERAVVGAWRIAVADVVASLSAGSGRSFPSPFVVVLGQAMTACPDSSAAEKYPGFGSA